MSLSQVVKAVGRAAALVAVLPLAAAAQHAHGASAPTVEVVRKDAERRVDVLVDGKLFTSYLYPSTLEKPVLWPLNTASGTAVTRGFPLGTKAGERVDHPHHVGLWFNYGDVNGLDFWNNSAAIKPEQKPKMGTIVHRAIRDTDSGRGQGELEVSMDWVDHQGKVILREETEFVFHAVGDLRAVDRITKLTALDEPVSMKDNKEGVLGLRVTRALEHPATKPERFTDASGRPTDVAVLNNEGVTGMYRTSEGIEGDAVWGTRGRWTSLSGVVEGDPVTVAILDHPENPGFPTYWHARGYGLFAANPLGQKELSGGKDELNFSLAPGQSTVFRHRILLLSGKAPPEQVETQYRAWAR